MTDRSRSGSGSLGGDDTDLGSGTTGGGMGGSSGSTDLGGSVGGTGGSLGSTDLGGSDFDTPARGSDLGMGTGGDLGSGTDLGGTTGGVTMGSTMGASDFSSGADLGGGQSSSGTEISSTTGGGTDVGETTGGGGGAGGSLAGAAIGALAGAAIGAAASALMGSGSGESGSSTIERTIEVNAPLRTVYNQWTQFEEFPRFMQGVERVQQLDDKRLHWHADIGFKDKEWDAEIVDQVPDQRVAWRSTSGAPNGGAVSFQSIDANRTSVTLRLDYDPEGLIENVGDTLGLVSRRVEGDLERFKQFIESRGTETGSWRGEIHGGG